MEFFVAADSAECAFLQKTQQLDLSLHCQIANFVEEERSAIGNFCTTLAHVNGTCESAFFVTEKFAFHKIFREGCAVERYKRLVFTRRKLHNCTSDHLFTRTATTANKHGRIRRSDLTHLFVHNLHFAAVANKFTRLTTEHVSQLLVFVNQGLAFHKHCLAFASSITRNVRDDFQKCNIAVQIRRHIDRTVY